VVWSVGRAEPKRAASRGVVVQSAEIVVNRTSCYGKRDPSLVEGIQPPSIRSVPSRTLGHLQRIEGDASGGRQQSIAFVGARRGRDYGIWSWIELLRRRDEARIIRVRGNAEY